MKNPQLYHGKPNQQTGTTPHVWRDPFAKHTTSHTTQSRHAHPAPPGPGPASGRRWLLQSALGRNTGHGEHRTSPCPSTHKHASIHRHRQDQHVDSTSTSSRSTDHRGALARSLLREKHRRDRRCSIVHMPTRASTNPHRLKTDGQAAHPTCHRGTHTTERHHHPAHLPK